MAISSRLVIMGHYMAASLTAYVRLAARAAREAGGLLVRYAGKPKTVETKRSVVDLVTEVDRSAERLIYGILHRTTPTFDFLGEEHGQAHRRSPYRWIVDPIDGTNNFVHGLPIFGVSIALEHRGRMLVGVIYDPMRRELFTAARGGGAFLNGARIRVSRARRLGLSLIATGFAFNFRRHPQPYLKWFQEFQRRSHGVRRIGSTVFCLAAIAAGRLEGFYERDLWPWDMAAGMLLVEEAGGRISDLSGGRPDLTAGQLLATNGLIHDQMLRIFKKRRHRL